MKISKVIKLLKELKSDIGGDPQVFIGENRVLKEDDFSILVRQPKSYPNFYSVGIKVEVE